MNDQRARASANIARPQRNPRAQPFVRRRTHVARRQVLIRRGRITRHRAHLLLGSEISFDGNLAVRFGRALATIKFSRLTRIIERARRFPLLFFLLAARSFFRPRNIFRLWLLRRSGVPDIGCHETGSDYDYAQQATKTEFQPHINNSTCRPEK